MVDTILDELLRISTQTPFAPLKIFPMNRKTINVVVTPPSFCKSPALREELLKSFPNSCFNVKNDRLPESELIKFCQNAQAAIIGRDLITERVVKALPQLKIISKYGVGLDNIAPKILERHGITLGWTAGVNRRSVAELTLCFMLGLLHNVFSVGYKLKNNIWNKEGGMELTGKTIGIIGCGNIGMEVVQLLSHFNCSIMINDIVDKTEFCHQTGSVQVTKGELIQQADIISLHVPLTELTREMVNEHFLERMKTNAFLINTSRGRVVLQSALKSALEKNLIAGAALDVFEEEPPDDPEFLRLPNLMVTPHIGGTAQEAIEAMGRSAISHLINFFRE